ncbi:MAG: transcription antitermination factor NusB [Oscillospiraceae bacterium]|jgi:N utilization substance protein B|nr:transcription antitermination factor NusB [Oscillospiraceae bacterium]
MKRTDARKRAFELLFAFTFYEKNEDVAENIENNNIEGTKIDDFTILLFKGVIKNKENIDLLIKKNIKNWSFERISRVVKTAIRLAVYEIIYEKDIPVGVSINESVEIAKEYGAKDESSYVQAVLASILNEIKQNEDHKL